MREKERDKIRQLQQILYIYVHQRKRKRFIICFFPNKQNSHTLLHSNHILPTTLSHRGEILYYLSFSDMQNSRIMSRGVEEYN